MNPRLGYCCINLSLSDSGIMTNRGMTKATFGRKGINYAAELALKNIIDLKKIIQWNIDHDILVYRMSSCIFPWMSEYVLTDLPNYDVIRSSLIECGDLATYNNVRLSFHPGPFNVLGSPTSDLINKTVNELNWHSDIMGEMGLPQSHDYPINIHVGGTYGDKEETLRRFIIGFNKLNRTTQSRLVVENDDKASQYSVNDLLFLFDAINIPITFDYHHHRFCSGGLSEELALRSAVETWQDSRPLFHYSSCKTTFEDPKARLVAHADYIYEQIRTYGEDIDIEIESKAKDLALLRYKTEKLNLLLEYKSFNV